VTTRPRFPDTIATGRSFFLPSSPTFGEKLFDKSLKASDCESVAVKTTKRDLFSGAFASSLEPKTGSNFELSNSFGRRVLRTSHVRRSRKFAEGPGPVGGIVRHRIG